MEGCAVIHSLTIAAGLHSATGECDKDREAKRRYRPSAGSRSFEVRNGANPFSQTVLLGHCNDTAGVSPYKEFAVTERSRLRLNLDAFNAFNIQGRVNPNTTDGIESLQTSC